MILLQKVLPRTALKATKFLLFHISGGDSKRKIDFFFFPYTMLLLYLAFQGSRNKVSMTSSVLVFSPMAAKQEFRYQASPEKNQKQEPINGLHVHDPDMFI